MRKNIIAVLTILFSIMVILLLSWYFFSIPEPAPDAGAIKSLFTLPVADFQPEPNERKLFILSVLLAPLLCGFFYILLNRSRILFSKRVKLYAQTILIATPVLFYLLVYYSLKNTIFPFLALSSFNTHPLLTFFSILLLLLVLVASLLLEQRYPSAAKLISPILYYSIGLSLVGLVASETIFNDTEPTIFVRNSFEHLHFIAYFDALVQTYLGKSPLTLNPQYGYYPFFLNPFFKVVSLSILSFALVMSSLKIIAYWGILITLRNVADQWLIALIGFSTMLFYTLIRGPLDISAEPYFQYNPHRLFFPALLIFLVWLYVSRKSRSARNIVYGLTTLASSISVLWNPDTGIIVFASWLLVLSYIELLELQKTGIKRVVQKILIFTAVNFSVFGLVILGIYVQYYIQNGTWPNLLQNFGYTSLFYEYGFYMLPLPRQLHPWMWVVLPYIVGIYLSISHLLDVNKQGASSIPTYNRQTDTRSTLIFAISIIGTGIFTYYQGRSHNYNLISISWPAYILLTLFTDQLLRNLSRIISLAATAMTKISLLGRYAHQLIFFGIFFYFLGSSIPTIIIHLPRYTALISTRLAGINQIDQSLAQQSEFIKTTSTPEDTVLILSDEATELYLYTSHQRPLDIPGFGELVAKADVNKLNQFLLHPPEGIKIYWDTGFRRVDPRTYGDLTQIMSYQNLILFEAVEK